MKEIFVTPVAGARVHDPSDKSRIIPPEGATVMRTAYILERLREGDLVQPAASAPRKKRSAD